MDEHYCRARRRRTGSGCSHGRYRRPRYHKTAPIPSTGRRSIYELREPAIDFGAWLDEDLAALRGARVLDAGCGPEMYAPAARERAADLVALDIAHGRLFTCR